MQPHGHQILPMYWELGAFHFTVSVRERPQLSTISHSWTASGP